MMNHGNHNTTTTSTGTSNNDTLNHHNDTPPQTTTIVPLVESQTEEENSKNGGDKDEVVMTVEEIEPLIDMIPFAVRISTTTMVPRYNNPDNNTIKINDNNDNNDNSNIATIREEEDTSTLNNHGIVGTITFIGPKSVMVWFGWGPIVAAKPILVSHSEEPNKPNKNNDNNSNNNNNNNEDDDDNVDNGGNGRVRARIRGGTVNRSFGPLVIGMPRWVRHDGDITAKNGVDKVPTTNSSSTSTTIDTNHYRQPVSSTSTSTSSTSKLIGDTSNNSTHQEMICTQMAERLSRRLGIAVLVSCNLFDTASTTIISSSSSVASFGGEGTMDEEYINSHAAAVAEKEIYTIIAATTKVTNKETKGTKQGKRSKPNRKLTFSISMIL